MVIFFIFTPIWGIASAPVHGGRAATSGEHREDGAQIRRDRRNYLIAKAAVIAQQTTVQAQAAEMARQQMSLLRGSGYLGSG